MNSEIITSKKLVQHFENRLRQRERSVFGGMGNAPYSPMLVVYLGEESIKAHKDIVSNLYQIWPQYFSELSFLGITSSGCYVKIPEDASGKNEEVISIQEVAAMTAAMFGTRAHFSNKNYLVVYFVMNTSNLRDMEDYYSWLPIMDDFKRTLGVAVQDMLMVLLNENFDLHKQELASRIRDNLSLYPGSTKLSGADTISMPCANSVLLLSNRRSDNTILEDWSACYRIMTSVMALANNNSIHTSFLFGNKVFTAGYAREEKPAEKIGRIVVRKMIEALASYDEDCRLIVNDGLASLLGISKQGTLVELDNYADEVMLPDPSIFPRNTNEVLDVSTLTAGEFNEITMGTWDLYLSQISQNVRDTLVHGSSVRELWKNRFKRALAKEFSTAQLVELPAHISEIKPLINPKQPSVGEGIISAARHALRYKLSTEPVLLQVYIEAIEELGESAREFKEAWRQLRVSQMHEFVVEERVLTDFYNGIVSRYFDIHKNELSNRMRNMQSVDELKSLLQETLDQIIESNSIFSAPFEIELEERLKQEGKAVDARDYIRNKLTGNNVKVYLKVPFAHEAPGLSALLLDTETQLKSSLAKTLIDIDQIGGANTTEDQYYYYNTGSNSSAEALKIYEVAKVNLVMQGETHHGI